MPKNNSASSAFHRERLKYTPYDHLWMTGYASLRCELPVYLYCNTVPSTMPLLPPPPPPPPPPKYKSSLFSFHSAAATKEKALHSHRSVQQLAMGYYYLGLLTTVLLLTCVTGAPSDCKLAYQKLLQDAVTMREDCSGAGFRDCCQVYSVHACR